MPRLGAFFYCKCLCNNTENYGVIRFKRQLNGAITVTRTKEYGL